MTFIACNTFFVFFIKFTFFSLKHWINSYRIYQLSGEGGVDTVYEIEGVDTEYQINNLSQGDYNFAITTLDEDGLESEYSQTISVSVI